MKLLKLRVSVNAKRNSIREIGLHTFEIKVKAPAERGEANKAALVLLSTLLKYPVKKFRIIKGHKSPSKIVSMLE